MFLAHSIRLRGLWQCEPTPSGGVRWTRSFHRPTGLEDDDLLWLVISNLPDGAQLRFNGVPFAPTKGAAGASASDVRATGVSPVRPANQAYHPNTDGMAVSPQPNQFDVTSILVETNCIEIDAPPPACSLQPPAFPYDVRLAIVGRS